MMSALFDFLQTMPFWYWWVLAVCLLTMELVTGTTHFLWPAAAALITGLFSLSPLGVFWQGQFFMFAAATIGLSLWAPQSVKRWLHEVRADHPTLNDRGAQKIGRRAVVDQAFSNGSGKIRLGDTLWLADSETGEDFDAGVQVEVTRAEGAKLFVKSVA